MRLTGCQVQNQVPHARPRKTRVARRERTEAILEQAGLGAFPPAGETMDGV